MIKFPFRSALPVEHSAKLPQAVDVVVIGAGIVGVMTAWDLVKRGQRVALLEKGRVGCEQSSRNWGWIRAQGRDPDELPIVLDAQRMWKEIAPTLDTDIGLKQGGVAYIASSEKELAKYEGWLPYARAHGMDTRILSRAELAALMPHKRDWVGALWTASDMRAEPWVTVPALARAAVRDGLVIVENCAVRSLDMAGGRVAGVNTETGTIRSERVVLAGGAWSSLFLRNHGVSIPQLSVRATVAATSPLPAITEIAGADERLAFRRRADGGYSLAAGGFHELFIGPDAFRALPKFLKQLAADPFGTKYKLAAPAGYPDGWGTPRHWSGSSPFEAMRVLDPTPHAGKVAELAKLFARAFPQLGEVKIAESWAGMIDTMPDVVPVIDHIPQLPGLTVATGMSGHGFGIGPGIGRVTAEIVMGQAPSHDLHRFRFSRFSDGSPVDLGPSL